MADKVEIDLIVEAISKGFDKIEKDLKGVGTASKKAGDEAKQGNEGFKDFGESMKKLGTIAAGAAVIIGGALVAGLVKSVMAASDAEESLSKFNVVFKDLEGGPEGLALEVDKLAEATGRSKWELIGAVGALGDLFQPLGFSADAAADLSLQMTSLAIDLSSFNNMPMDEALQRLQGTLIGSHENALAFGVVINENTLKAQMMKEGTDKLTGAQFEQAKVQARLNLLMAGTTAAQGDAIRTADGFANQVKALQGEIKDLAVEMGNELLPLATELIGSLRTLAQDAAPAATAAVGFFADGLRAATNVAIGYKAELKGILAENEAQITSQAELEAEILRVSSAYQESANIVGMVSGTTKELKNQFADLAGRLVDVSDNFEEYSDRAGVVEEALKGVYGETVKVIGNNVILNGKLITTVDKVYEAGQAWQENQRALEENRLAMQYWVLASKDVEDAATRQNEAVKLFIDPMQGLTDVGYDAAAMNNLLAIDVIQATNAIEGMTPAVEAATGAIYASDEAIKAYAASTGDYATQAMNAGEEGINLNSIMYASADANGANAETLVGLALAQGTVTAAKAEAILKEAALIEKAEEYGAMLAAGTITINDAVTGMQNFAAGLDTSNIAVNNATGSVILLDESLIGANSAVGSLQVGLGDFNTANAVSATQDFIDHLNRIPRTVDVQVNVHGGEGITAPGGHQPGLDPGSGSGGAATSGGGGTGTGGGGYVAPGAAVGANYVVPPGYNENWYQPVSTGERVVVTPDGSNPGGGMTVNNNFNGPVNPGQVMREIEISRAMMGI